MSTSKAFCFFLGFFLALQTVSAEEHGSGTPAKEEKSEGEGKGDSKGNIQLTPLMEAETKVSEFAAKIRSKQAFLQRMIEEKDKLKENSPEVKVKLNDILKEYAELQRLNEEYEKQLNILKYRFPERNAKTAKKYDRFEVKSIIEMEQALGIDGKLSRNMQKMRAQYKSAPATTTAGASGHRLNSTTTTLNPPEGSIEESGSVLIQK